LTTVAFLDTHILTDSSHENISKLMLCFNHRSLRLSVSKITALGWWLIF